MLGPVGPVLARPDLLDDLGVDRIAPLIKIGEDEIELALLPPAVLATADPDHVDFVVAGGGQGDPVDECVKPLVVRPQCLEDLPHRGVALVVPERLLRSHPRGDADRQDDVAELLVAFLVEAHDTAYGLHDVDD